VGVMATFCQLCGIATQHDHYVHAAAGTPFGRTMKVYREPGPHVWARGERPFPFEEKHAWLRDAVVVRHEDGSVHRGHVVDGVMSPSSGGSPTWIGAGDGTDGATAWHALCWERLGAPRPTAPLAFSTQGSYEWAFMEAYQGQLFDFHELCVDDRGFLLDDPRSSARASAHLDRMVQVAREQDLRRASDQGGSWRGGVMRAANGARLQVGRVRLPVRDRHAFPHAVWFDVKFEATSSLHPELEAFERRLKALVERDERALFVSALMSVSRALFTWYARVGDGSLQEVEALGAPPVGSIIARGTRPDSEWELLTRRKVSTEPTVEAAAVSGMS